MEKKTVRAVRRISAVPEHVYNVRVAKNHNYFANGVLVHNCDDPNSARETSDTILDSTIAWWDQVMSTRLNDRRTGHKVVIQQRTHEKDLSGHIQSRTDGEWTWLILPLEFEPARRAVTVILPTTDGKPWQDPRTEPGESLWPNRWGPKEIVGMKADLGSEYAVSGQLQQRPAPEAGGIIKKAWFQWWKKPLPPRVEFTLQSWDTALGVREVNAWTACTTWGVFRDDHMVPNVILLSAFRSRWEYPELRKIAKRMAIDYRDDVLDRPIQIDDRERTARSHRPDVILVEAKGSGISLIQDLARADIVPTPFIPDKYGDKLARVRIISHVIEAGRLWLPAMPPAYTALRPWADMFVEQAAAFPNAESRDLVDTMTQALLRLSTSGWVWNPADQAPAEPDEDMDMAPAESFY